MSDRFHNIAAETVADLKAAVGRHNTAGQPTLAIRARLALLAIERAGDELGAYEMECAAAARAVEPGIVHHVTADYFTPRGSPRKLTFDVEADNLQAAIERANVTARRMTKHKARRLSVSVIPAGALRTEGIAS